LPQDEPPMTACGGNIIGGEISRNKQCPHEADLRRLRLRIWARGAPSVSSSILPLYLNGYDSFCISSSGFFPNFFLHGFSIGMA
jgi:hypothetical protein